MLKHIFLFILICLAIAAGAFFYLSRGDTARLSVAELSGREPQLTAPRKEFIPTANIAKAVGWKANEKPVAPKGLMVESFADGLAHPRSMLRLGNGRSEEHTSDIKSLMRTSYAVFCLKKQKTNQLQIITNH